MTNGDWQRLAHAVRTRRNELGLTQEEAASQSDGQVSSATWRKIEKGETTSFRAPSLVGICRALDWQFGSVEDILEGGEPTIAGPVPPVEDVPASRVDELSDRIDRLDLEVRQIRSAVDNLVAALSANGPQQ